MAQRGHPNQPLRLSDLLADRAAALRLTPVSYETRERLDRFVALLLQWQAKTNLIAPSTVLHLWTRHVSDSLQLLQIAPDALVWVDFGSGGGFPGLVLACALARQPAARVHLVERNTKKAAFLREALRVTGAQGIVHDKDIGDSLNSLPDRIDCVTARALAPLAHLLRFAEPVMARGARGLFFKGQDVAAELAEATKYWSIAPVLHGSRTGNGCIVDLATLSRRDALPPSANP